MIAELHDMILIETVPSEKCTNCYFYDETSDCAVLRPSNECRDEYGRRSIWKRLSNETRTRLAPHFITGDKE